MLGYKMYLYYNSGTQGSPTWGAFTLRRDVTPNVKRSESDASIRGWGGYGGDVATLAKIDVTFDSLYIMTDTVFAALWANFLANTPTEFAFADGVINTNGTNYLRANCAITQANRKEPLEGPVTVEWNVKGTPFLADGTLSNAPSFVTVGT